MKSEEAELVETEEQGEWLLGAGWWRKQGDVGQKRPTPSYRLTNSGDLTYSMVIIALYCTLDTVLYT